jgi:hypothetical protein
MEKIAWFGKTEEMSGVMILPQRKEIFDAVPKAVFRLFD